MGSQLPETACGSKSPTIAPDLRAAAIRDDENSRPSLRKRVEHSISTGNALSLRGVGRLPSLPLLEADATVHAACSTETTLKLMLST